VRVVDACCGLAALTIDHRRGHLAVPAGGGLSYIAKEGRLSRC